MDRPKKMEKEKEKVYSRTPPKYARWDLMPYELWLMAVENLDVEDILSLCRTSKEFAGMCEDNYLWKFLLKRDYRIKWTRREGAKEEYIFRSFHPMVSCGADHTGFITRDKKLYMWGQNNYGQLGDGTLVDKKKPILVNIKGNVQIIQLSCGWDYTAAVTAEGELYTWGINNGGKLGTGRGNKKIPTLVNIKGNVIQVSCGKMHTGAITAEGELYMSGQNWCGQLGDGSETTKWKPILVYDERNERFTQVSCGRYHTGAITAEGELYMWGGGGAGQLGDNTNTDSLSRTTPINIKGNPKIIQVSCGRDHTGAITESGKLYMWGDNEDGQLGDGTGINKKIPVLIMEDIAQVSCGGSYTAAVTIEGELYMWGQNNRGQLGDGTQDDATEPIFIMKNIIQVSCGFRHTGAVTVEGELLMWGHNKYGQIGDGTKSHEDKEPTLIIIGKVPIPRLPKRISPKRSPKKKTPKRSPKKTPQRPRFISAFAPYQIKLAKTMVEKTNFDALRGPAKGIKPAVLNLYRFLRRPDIYSHEYAEEIFNKLLKIHRNRLNALIGNKVTESSIRTNIALLLAEKGAPIEKVIEVIFSREPTEKEMAALFAIGGYINRGRITRLYKEEDVRLIVEKLMDIGTPKIKQMAVDLI